MPFFLFLMPEKASTVNLSWLDDFFALAASGHFSRAAAERHMTQPAFSRRIRALEAWLGAELFDRSVQPARLTAAGEWFRGTAHELQARIGRLPGEAQSIVSGEATTLRFAATHALSFSFMPGWLKRLESAIAIGPLNLVSDVFERCEAALQEGRVQFVLSHSHPAAADRLAGNAYPFICIGRDALIPVSAPVRQGAPRHRWPPAPRSRSEIMRYSPESGLSRILDATIGARLDALPSHLVFTAHLASALRTWVIDGRGLAWLPETLVAPDLTAGRLVVAAADEWKVPLEVRLYRDRFPMTDAAEDFWRAVTAASPDA